MAVKYATFPELDTPFLRVRYKRIQQTAKHPERVGSGKPSPSEISVFSFSTPVRKYCSVEEIMVIFVVSEVISERFTVELTQTFSSSMVWLGVKHEMYFEMSAPDGMQIFAASSNCG